MNVQNLKQYENLLDPKKVLSPHLENTKPDKNGPVTERIPPMLGGSGNTEQNAKTKQMDGTLIPDGKSTLTNDNGAKVANNQKILSANKTGPSLIKDFHFFEKMAHFSRERIPERVVHARGAGAHGVFKSYGDWSEFTSADFLNAKDKDTPVFVRFSTVQGFRGSADTVRDTRGFAVKFYTNEGNFDIVGIDFPVFFVQSAMKFADVIHSVKPEPATEIPQGQSAHDTFYDFISLQPEALHHLFWVLSDRGIPRDYANMEGFGVHSYRLINKAGKSVFVRWHWKPLAKPCSLVWKESQEICGRDPDFHRRNLWLSIQNGQYPEFELGAQIFTEEQAEQFGFDHLDPTKLVPESLVPVMLLGKMTLNRNPDDFFCETEQVAFSPANIVAGIDFSNDPLLQGRIFAYDDAQRYRLGGPNFKSLPINRPICPMHNYHQAGFAKTQTPCAPANYEPNSLNDNYPREADPKKENVYKAHADRLEGHVTYEPSPSFFNFYSQPRLFFMSLTDVEKNHLTDAFVFELGKVTRAYIRERMIDLVAHVDVELAQKIAEGLGLQLTETQKKYPAPPVLGGVEKDASISLYANNPDFPLKGRRVAVLLASLTEADQLKPNSVLDKTIKELQSKSINVNILAEKLLPKDSDQPGSLCVDATTDMMLEVLYDAFILVGDKPSKVIQDYLAQARSEFKPIAVLSAKGEGVALNEFLTGVCKHRLWNEVKTK